MFTGGLVADISFCFLKVEFVHEVMRCAKGGERGLERGLEREGSRECRDRASRESIEREYRERE